MGASQENEGASQFNFQPLTSSCLISSPPSSFSSMAFAPGSQAFPPPLSYPGPSTSYQSLPMQAASAHQLSMKASTAYSYFSQPMSSSSSAHNESTFHTNAMGHGSTFSPSFSSPLPSTGNTNWISGIHNSYLPPSSPPSLGAPLYAAVGPVTSVSSSSFGTSPSRNLPPIPASSLPSLSTHNSPFSTSFAASSYPGFPTAVFPNSSAISGPIAVPMDASHKRAFPQASLVTSKKPRTSLVASSYAAKCSSTGSGSASRTQSTNQPSGNGGSPLASYLRSLIDSPTLPEAVKEKYREMLKEESRKMGIACPQQTQAECKKDSSGESNQSLPGRVTINDKKLILTLLNSPTLSDHVKAKYRQLLLESG